MAPEKISTTINFNLAPCVSGRFPALAADRASVRTKVSIRENHAAPTCNFNL